MLLEMGLIAAGIPAGWLLRKSRNIQAAVGIVLTWAVRVLLFLLGLSLGADAALLARIDELGLQAAVISTLSVTGCLLAAWLLGRFFHLDNQGPKDSTQNSGAPHASGSEPSTLDAPAEASDKRTAQVPGEALVAIFVVTSSTEGHTARSPS